MTATTGPKAAAKLTAESSPRATSMQRACEDLKDAIDAGEMGNIVAKHEALILHYYSDVQDQAKHSFMAAESVARIGFWVLIGALVYTLVFDALGRLQLVPPSAGSMSLTVAKVGTVSAALIEFIAAITFWLYARGAKQFSAFHICLERTHRYLLAYAIADQMTSNKDSALKDLACIMANAPMITRWDIDSVTSKDGATLGAQPKAATVGS